MKTISPNNEDRRFDRLVDNELSEAERRELLTGLDDEPGGWRRCALAFLESQCWKAAFRSVAKESASPRWGGSSTAAPTAENALPAPAARPASRRRSVWLGRAETALAMAASFAAALLVASWFQQGRMPVGRPAGADPGNQVAAIPTPGNQPTGPMGGPRGTPSPNGPWQMVTLTSPSAATDDAGALRLPAVERQDVDEAWLHSLPPAIPDDVLQALSRNGYKIQQKRELVPVPMKDGRRLMVPVDQVELHYIGNGAY